MTEGTWCREENNPFALAIAFLGQQKIRKRKLSERRNEKLSLALLHLHYLTNSSVIPSEEYSSSVNSLSMSQAYKEGGGEGCLLFWC